MSYTYESKEYPVSSARGIPNYFWAESFGFMHHVPPVDHIEHATLDRAELLELYKLNRDYIKHEDNLINFRLTWLLTIHGFLYATYGFSAQSLANSSAQLAVKAADRASRLRTMYAFKHNAHMAGVNSTLQALVFLMLLISGVGLCISFFGIISISAANRAASSVATIFEKGVRKYHLMDNCYVHVLGSSEGTFLVPTLTGGGWRNADKQGFAASRFIPYVLFGSWLISLIYDGILFYRFLWN